MKTIWRGQLAGGIRTKWAQGVRPALRLNEVMSSSIHTSAICNQRPWNVLFFGSDTVSLKTLEALQARKGSLVDRLEVVTHKQTKQEGASKVAQWSRKNKIPVHEWPHPNPLPEAITPWNFDIGVVVSFGYLIPQSLIQSFPKSMINMHPSLLPKYRGPAPIHHPLLNNDAETGISIITLHPTEFDKGEILQQERVPIDPMETHLTLEPRLAELGAKIVINTLENYDELYDKRWPQDKTGVAPSKARVLNTKDANIKWSDWTASQVIGRWRALPLKTYTFFKGKPVKLPSLQLVPSDPAPAALAAISADCAPGTIVWDKASRSILVKCKEGWVSVLEAHLPGKPRKRSEDFANGYGLKNFNPENRFSYEDREATTEKTN